MNIVSICTLGLKLIKMPEVRVGDEVTVLGDYPKINAYALADNADIGNIREIITSINPRIPRVVV